MYLYRLLEFLQTWLWWAQEYWEGLYFRHIVRLLQVCLSSVSMLGNVLFIFFLYIFLKIIIIILHFLNLFILLEILDWPFLLCAWLRCRCLKIWCRSRNNAEYDESKQNYGWTRGKADFRGHRAFIMGGNLEGLLDNFTYYSLIYYAIFFMNF